MPYRLILLLICLLASTLAAADVVKPALTEISVYADGRVSIEVRTSLEALLTGIDGRYRNTQDAPNAEFYDRLRKLSAQELAESFQSFREVFIGAVKLTVDRQAVSLNIASITIPEPGYTKVPRTSIIRLRGQLAGNHQKLQWYYPSRFGDQAVRVKQIDEVRDFWHWSDYQWIREDRVSEPFLIDGLIVKSSWYSVLYTYLEAGFLHILPWGADHLLFVLGLLLMSRSLRPLLWQVTMFTLAHSLTLSLSTLGIFTLPAIVVEPLIALSIAYVAIENLFTKVVGRWRLIVIFAFGLLHGLGFAAMLAEFGLPENNFLLALFGFNLGVELGQVSIILICWLSFVIWFRDRPGYRRFVVLPASALIALTGLWWFWQRLDWQGMFNLA